MVEAHVAGLAGLRLLGLGDREDMPGVAGIAGGAAEPGTCLLQVADIGFGLEADLVATGWAWAVGMAFMAAQARACLPFLNWVTFSSWHWAQVSGVGIRATA
jgi:hypothetical protein